MIWWTAAQADAKTATVSTPTVQTLAQSPAGELPGPKVFVAVLEFSQVPGAACGPTCWLPGFVYTLHGVVTTSSPGAAMRSVGQGEAAFTPAVAEHTNDKVEGRIGAGALGAGLIVIVILLCAATWFRGGRRRAIIAVLSLLLIAGSVLVLSGATSNDWYFVAVRPESQFSQPMPRPDGRVIYASPDVNPVLGGPYLETLSSITVPPDARYDAPDVTGPETIMVVEGTASVHVGAEIRQVSRGQATLSQAGQNLAIVNSGSGSLRLLDFVLTPSS
jgi:quercetin dioxygenase-like cupin family protein